MCRRAIGSLLMEINSPHIEFERIVDLVEGRAPAHERASMASHISSCPRCSEMMKEIETAVHTMQTDTSEDAPGFAINAAINTFRATIKPQSTLRRVLAALKFDSLSLTPAYGLRSAVQPERQLIFIAGDNELQLHVSPAGEEWKVEGQVLGPCSGGHVELRGEEATVQTDLNALCEFAFPLAASGNYTLILQLAEAELYIPDLRLGDQS